VKEYVIWPEYLSANLSRRRGRRVNKALSVVKIKPEAVLKACTELNWKCRIEEGRYPRTWFESHGFKIIVVLENEVGNKHKLIKTLASKLKEIGEKPA